MKIVYPFSFSSVTSAVLLLVFCCLFLCLFVCFYVVIFCVCVLILNFFLYYKTVLTLSSLLLCPLSLSSLPPLLSLRMELGDWVEWFSSVCICRQVNTKLLSLEKTWHEALFNGSWKKPMAGGCVNNKDTFCNNPQVRGRTKHQVQ